jgi:MFS transporter, ACDE family, multidrug resistance protein
VAALSAVGSSGYGTLTPALAELGESYGVSALAVGLLQGVVAVPGIALALVLGRLADLLGHGRVALTCLLLFVATGTSCVFVDHFETALALRLVQGIGFAGLLTIPPTVIGDRTEGASRRRGVATNSMILTTASTLGPVLGGVLADTADPRNTFWIYVVGLALVPSTIVVLGMGPGRSGAGAGSARQVVADLRVRRSGAAVLGALALTLGTIALVSAVTSAMLPLMLAADFDLGVSERGVFIGLTNVGSVAASATLVLIAGRLGDRSGALLGLALMGTALVALVLAPSPAVVVVVVLVLGFGVGTTYNSALHLISRQEVRGRGLLMGAWSSAGRSGQFLGPIAGAALVTGVGTELANLAAGAGCLLAGAGVAVAARTLHRRTAAASGAPGAQPSRP